MLRVPARRRVLPGREAVEVIAKLLDPGEVTGKHSARVVAGEPVLGTYVTHGAHEWRRVEAGERGDALRERHVVSLRLPAVQSDHGAEQHHHRAEARRDQLPLSPGVRTGEQRSLPELEQLPHHLLLELEAQVL